MRANKIKMKIMSKNKQHSSLEVKCKKSRTAHSQDRNETIHKRNEKGCLRK